MRHLISMIMIASGACATAQDFKLVGRNDEKAYRVEPATVVQSIEDTAMTFFRGLAHRIENYPSEDLKLAPKDILRDRDGFNETESEEIIDLARRLNSFEVSPAIVVDSEKSTRQFCSELRGASTTEQAVKALEADEELTRARNRLIGASVLAELKPSTRAHLIEVLKEFRKNVTVGSIEWTRVTPDELGRYSDQRCSQPR